MNIIGTIGTVLSVAKNLKDALEAKELIERLFDFGLRSELDNFKRTVDTLTAVLRDAETKQELSHQLSQQIEELKEAFFNADDLLDEFVTLVSQQRLLDTEGSIREKISNFFSSSNPICVSYWMSRGIKDIKKKLDAIAYNSQFNLNIDLEPIRMRRPGTCSYVNEVDIIGRGEDLEKIVGLLLDPNVQQDLSFLSIVGIGGLGKTALTQLVFNDPRVTSAFPLKLWTCVSDQDQKQLDVKEVLGKILASATGSNFDESTLDQVQSQLRQCLADKRYLLILDDVWTENHHQWCVLAQYFVGGHRGSWIVVTTRSQRTATIIGEKACQMYALQGLSKENSWNLFEKTAFGPSEPVDDLIKIGQNIVDGCAGVPLAIRVVGSLLYGQGKKKWQLVHASGLASIKDSENDIMPILKLSYYHLESPLKNCFSYCAIFPKDVEIEKEKLIGLWMAQGYVTSYDSQCAEDVGEEYFSILLKRCFFQDIKKNESGEIMSCKMHDLIHDIAQSVSGGEIYVANTISGRIDNKVRHLSIANKGEYGNYSLGKTCIRSHLHVASGHAPREARLGDCVFVETLISCCRCLRACDLTDLGIKSVPDSIGKLLHLRYLDLSKNINLELLPKSITELCNLQTLKLHKCGRLKELPKNLSRLTKLRVLDISFCSRLNCMPKSLNKLNCLQKLSDFIVGSEGSFVSWSQWFDGLLDLRVLNNLIGNLKVHILWPENADNNVGKEDNIRTGFILRNMEHLNSVELEFKGKKGSDRRLDNGKGAITVMEDLHPHSNIKVLDVWGYNGTRMPDWVSHLPKLVKLRFIRCEELEYIRHTEELSLLPSLENLTLKDMPKLKCWRREIVVDQLHQLLSDPSSSDSNVQLQVLPKFCQLKSLVVSNCPELACIPLCPKLEKLLLMNFNRRLIFGEAGHVLDSASASVSELANMFSNLRYVTIDNVTWLNSLPAETFQCLEKLEILRDEKLESLGEIQEVFLSCFSSLQLLDIGDCPKLRSVVVGGLEHLTALEALRFNYRDNPMLLEEKEGEDCSGFNIDINIMPCPSLLPSLRTLEFWDLPQLESLPNWMQFLPALQTLEIRGCPKLKAMPNWMPKLTSLRQLDVSWCPKILEKRCQKEPPGEDWPFIRHIPNICFIACYEDSQNFLHEPQTPL